MKRRGVGSPSSRPGASWLHNEANHVKHDLRPTRNKMYYVAMTLVQAVKPGKGKPKSIYMSAFHSDGFF